MNKLLLLGTTLTISILSLNTSVNAQVINPICDFDQIRNLMSIDNLVESKLDKEQLYILLSNNNCNNEDNSYIFLQEYDNFILWFLGINTGNYSYGYYYYNEEPFSDHKIYDQKSPSLQDILNNPYIDSTLKNKLENKLGKIYESQNIPVQSIPINNNINSLQNPTGVFVNVPNRLSTNFGLQNPTGISVETPKYIGNINEINSIPNQNGILSPSTDFQDNYIPSHTNIIIGNNITSPTDVNYGGYNNMINQPNLINQNQISIPQNINLNFNNR